ncbi:alkene reductase [Streptomyces sp. A7024]|uniref:Alkene reductase n=1 Tax=Streptomyces coryli TaxID=1128680 RepID=A0A6G4UBP2_9ACTN|nr:alkene reductase [Streptomyces coryli]NGN69563.1 alkene reductase [Streptomyces coryli]
MTNNIFEPVTVGKLDLPHRLVMAPMTRSRATAEDGLVTDLHVEYYGQRAGAGLIITEGTQPSVRGQGYIQTPGLHSAEQVAAWRRVTDRVHAGGGKIFAQLMHAGRVGHPYLYPDGGLPEAPSPVPTGEALYTNDQGMLDHPAPRELTLEDIARVIEDFASAARNAVAAGFDGVEIHGANGYLIHQFLADNTNLRTDAYGAGSVENRIRFAVEVTQAVVDAIGAERVGLRISPDNEFNAAIRESGSLPTYLALIERLNPLGLAYLHAFETDRAVTRELRRAWDGSLILNFASDGRDVVAEAEKVLAEDVADVVAVGRLWLANPDLTDRVKAGGPYNEGDPAAFYGGDHRGYIDYPALGS